VRQELWKIEPSEGLGKKWLNLNYWEEGEGKRGKGEREVEEKEETLN